MGMYLMRQIGEPWRLRQSAAARLHGVPQLEGTAGLRGMAFEHFPYALLMVVLAPGALAFVFGWFAFRARVTGVYLSIITQALTFALMLAFFRNDFGFGGNNGLTDFKDILGFNVQAQSTRAALFATILRSALGHLPSSSAKAIVDLETSARCWSRSATPSRRTRFLGYRVENYKLVRLDRTSACMAGHRRCALRAAGRHHQSRRIRAGEFDRGRFIWVGGRRARHVLVGRDASAPSL
jgi:urea transport system permease protein